MQDIDCGLLYRKVEYSSKPVGVGNPWTPKRKIVKPAKVPQQDGSMTVNEAGALKLN
jgi:hypothetical protein